MVCIRFQGIIMVLPIDKNKSKVSGKREGFFVLIKRTAWSYTCVAVYVVCMRTCIKKKNLILNQILSTDLMMYGVHALSCVYLDFSATRSFGMYQLQSFMFYGYYYYVCCTKKLKKFSSLVRHTIDKSHICSHHHQSKVLWIEV